MKEWLTGMSNVAALLAWGTVLALVLLPLLRLAVRRLNGAWKNHQVGLVLGALAVGIFVVYGGTKPSPTPEEPVKHTITYDLNDNTDAPAVNNPDNPETYTEGGIEIQLGAPTREGYFFMGWEPEGVIPSDATSDFTFVAQWRLPVESHIVYELNDTEDSPADNSANPVSHLEGTAEVQLVEPTREGFVFVGWEPEGVIPADTTNDLTFVASWRRPIVWSIEFTLEDGTKVCKKGDFDEGMKISELPVPTSIPEGMEFVGWMMDGKLLDPNDCVSGNTSAKVTLVAKFQKKSDSGNGSGNGSGNNSGNGSGNGSGSGIADWDLGPLWNDVLADGKGGFVTTDGHEQPFAASATAVFNGLVLDASGIAVGMFELKSSKATARRAAKLTATIKQVGKKDIKFAGALGDGGNAELPVKGKVVGTPQLKLKLGVNGVNGTWGNYVIMGARNVFKAKGDALVSALDRWQGVYTVALETDKAEGKGAALGMGWSTLSVNVGNKGKSKVTGTMADGTRVSVSSQLLVGDKYCLVPVMAPLYSKKGGFAFGLALVPGKGVKVMALGDWDASASKTPFVATFADEEIQAAKLDALAQSYQVSMPVKPDAIDGMSVFVKALPEGLAVQQINGRLSTVKGSKVKLNGSDLEGADGENPSAFKLAYAAKTGLTKGSFNLYALNGGKLKKYSVKVNGAVVGGVGYGTATVSKLGSWAILLK